MNLNVRHQHVLQPGGANTSLSAGGSGGGGGGGVSATDRMAIFMSVLNSTCVSEEARDTAQAAVNQLLSELSQVKP
jgi:hypothetical protein